MGKVEQYQDLVDAVSSLTGNEVNEAIAAINKVLSLMEKMDYPESDLEKFEEIQASFSEARQVLSDWLDVKWGVPIANLEIVWDLPEGSLDY